MSIVRILVADDAPSWRKLVAFVLAPQASFKVICEAGDGQRAVEMASALRPTVVLLDIGLPKICGIEVARQVLTRTPQAKVIFLSEQSEPEVLASALQIGASGYVLKYYAARDLVSAIHAVLRNETFVSRGLPSRSLH